MAMTTELSTVQQPARRILFIFLGGYATNNVYNVINLCILIPWGLGLDSWRHPLTKIYPEFCFLATA